MSLLYSVVFATRCRSTHHRLALDGLRHMKGPDAAGWRSLLLYHHEQYLKGAKAPDAEFKDFKNHVLHVRDGDWGGALSAAEEWRRRLTRAIQAKDWAHVAWCAGVMSHYVVDPHQPFHTHQTEEENTIHRAVEWSFFKSYAAFQTIIDGELGGYPQIELSPREDWLSGIVREGAQLATKEYEFVVDHYNFEVGAKRPAEGLDQPLRVTIAKLVARAAVVWGRVLDRVFAEAGQKPPKIDEGLQGYFLALEAPIQSVLKLVEDVQERAVVAAQYEEFKRTGKVRATLSEDDTTVRALYAAEVLKAPLSSLDAQWPREIGAAHQPSSRALKKRRKSAQRRASPAPLEPAPPPLRTQAPAQAAPAPVMQAAPPAPPPIVQPPPIAQPAAQAPPPPAPVETESAQAPKRKRGAAAALDASAALPSVEKREEPPPPPLLLTKKIAARVEEGEPLNEEGGLTLLGASPIEDAPSIGPKTARRLASLGVFTVSDLLALKPATAAVLLNVKHISAIDIADWQTQAVLACTIPDLKSREAQALVGAGYRDAESVAQADAKALASQMRDWIAGARRVWGEAAPPSEADAANLIQRARMGARPKANA
ncbi:MAG: DUF4332 domain-containing protein [Hyphomonadaceae bacterium]